MSMRNANLNHSLIICSRNRATSLLEMLETVIPQQGDVCLVEILLVLNLDSDHEFNSLTEKIVALPFNRFKVVRTGAGLPSARNIGIRSMENSDVIHFLDDDVRVGEGYFKHVENFLRQNPNVDGGAPIEMSSIFPIRANKLFKVKNFLGMIPVPGKVSISMRNYWGSVNDNSPRKVDWLPGLAMFYKRSSIDGYYFNEKLESFTLGGYSLGEDLIFTLKLTEDGRTLFAIPELKLTHARLPNVANQRQDISYANGELRKELLRIFPNRFNPMLYLISVILDHILLSFKTPVNCPLNIRRACVEIYSFLRH